MNAQILYLHFEHLHSNHGYVMGHRSVNGFAKIKIANAPFQKSKYTNISLV